MERRFVAKLFFEGLSNTGESDLFVYDGSGTPIDLTADFGPDEGAGIVDGYDNEIGALDVDPGPVIAAAGGNVFFSGNYNGLDTLFVYNGTSVTELEPANAWGSGIIPQDLVADGAKVFFVGINAEGDSVLWRSKGTVASTKEVAGSPTDLGDMTLQSGILFFRDDAQLEAFNTATGAFSAVGGPAGLAPQDLLSAYSSGLFFTPSTNLFMAGTDAAGHQNIYMQNGSTLEQFRSNVYSGGMNPEQLTGLTTLIALNSTTTLNDSGVYFSGVDNADGERGLYFVNANSGASLTGVSKHQAIDIVASDSSGSGNGLDPYDLTAFKGELYFTGNDSYSSGRGLFVYNPATSSATELIKSTQLDLTDGYVASWGAANAPTLAVYGGELYFGAANPNAFGAASVNQLYEYSGSGSIFNLVSVSGQNTIGGQPANLIRA